MSGPLLAPGLPPAQELRCPLCCLPADEMVLPVVFGADGLPVEAATGTGWGLPVIGGDQGIRVFVDGAIQKDAVAYSVPQGWAGKPQRDPDGNIIVRFNSVAYELVRGTVTIEQVRE